ncbi:MAG: hypothetical protein CVV51_06130 [Spirochaetae bacterium HGW-Spirochaetae-7]|jgi:hypothetical protein|nr:MAG: hypothetical protein CVV51_06130 [Spirochaetae bacterium HGW-Spirochaetae-7]
MRELEVLAAEIRKNIEVADRIRDFTEATENHDVAILGKTPATALMMAAMIENYYTCLETLFLRISQSFENHLEEKRWHQTLLDRMTLQVPNIREQVISDRTRRELGELLKFRHFKRYYFEFEYDWDRIDFLLKKLKDIHPRVKEELTHFLDFLQAAAGES